MKLSYTTKLFVFSLLLFANTTLFGQAPNWSWAKSLSNSAGIYSYDVAIDYYGSIYTTGYFYDSTITFGNTILTGGINHNPFLVKYSAVGDIKWAINVEKIGTTVTNSDRSNGVAVDNIGNCYITGYFESAALVFNSDTLDNKDGGNTGFIAKYDAGGNVLWSLKISRATPQSIIIDKEGYIYCAGQFSSPVYIYYINNGVTKKDTINYSGTGYNDIFLIKYTPDGDLVWAKSYGGSTSSEYINDISTDNSNNILLGGYWKTGTTSTTILGTDTFTSKGKGDAFVMKLDRNGIVLWAEQIGSSNSDYLFGVKVNNSVYVTGSFEADVTIGSYTLVNKGGADIFLIKFDSLGNVLWAKSYAGSSSDIAYGLALDNAENIYVTGYYSSWGMIIDNYTLKNASASDVLLLKIDSSGTTQWIYTAGGNGTDIGTGITSDKNNNLYLMGSYTSPSIAFGSDTITTSNTSVNHMFLASWIDFSDTVSIVDTSHVYELDNGGLYNGTSSDLTYSSTTNRLFSGIETPASLFISDDGANSWYQAFDNDSLEYAGETRGWSGNATRVLSNQNAWVAVLSNHPDNKYSSIVLSTSNGDTNTWKTVVDPYLLNQWGYSSYQASSIALSDYNLHAALGPYIVKTSGANINPSTDINNIHTAISGLASTSTINSIAVSNNSTGYPYYVAIDESGSPEGHNRLLYKYDGNNYTKIILPAALSGIQSVFTHPSQITGDTLFITGYYHVNNKFKIYRSYDAGATWTDISYSSATRFLSDVDYSPSWNLSSSNDLILIIPGNAISKDLGSSWESMSDTSFQANAINPTNMNVVVGSSKAVEISTTGAGGSFTRTPNYGLEALQVNKIARTESEAIFYIATQTGIGYSSAYLDTSISAGEKWNTPYGAFPLISDTINFGSVAIDPTDSLHVIAGCKYGFYVTTTGPNGFSAVLPTNFNDENPQVKDILILNNTTAIAVTGGDSAYDAGKGNIWRTTDGGLNWINVSPFNFESGNTIALGKSAGDTVIFIGSGLLNQDMGYLWKSTDNGITWDQIKNGPTSMAGTTILGLPINDIAVDPRGKDTLYIAAGYNDEYAFIVSLDGGENFIYLNAHAEKPYTSVAINRTYPDTVYTASGREIYLYDLANNNFRFVYRGLPDEKIPDLMTGSILVGTTTGFYTFDPTLVYDTADSTITKNVQTLENPFMVNVFPNPFTNDATISLSITENSPINIELYDLSGRKLSEIYNGNCNKGNSRFNIDGENLASGSYLLSIKVKDSASRQLLYHIK